MRNRIIYAFLQMKEIESYIKYRNKFYMKILQLRLFGLIIDKVGQKLLYYNLILLRGGFVILKIISVTDKTEIAIKLEHKRFQQIPTVCVCFI
jgi:hypothetical protein